MHTRRSPGTGWLDKPVKADIATSHDKRGGSCCLAAAFDFYFGLMFDDTQRISGVFLGFSSVFSRVFYFPGSDHISPTGHLSTPTPHPTRTKHATPDPERGRRICN